MRSSHFYFCKITKDVQAKYGMANSRDSCRVSTSYGTSCWKGIMDQMDSYKNAITVEIELGINILFWDDKWCSCRPLKLEVPFIFNIARNQDAKVVDYWRADGEDGGG